jgi:hypothetical protein
LFISSTHANSLRIDHPFIGTWRIDVPSLSCHEVYRVHADGTTFTTSAEEVSESIFTISNQPSDKGFYTWVDTISKDNGQKDCSGGIMQIGHEATNFIIFNRTVDQFLLCQTEDLNSCLGPFVRMKDENS